MTPRRFQDSRGAASVVAVMVFSTVTALFIGSLVSLTKSVAKGSVGFKDEEGISQLAEAAVERGAWKLLSNQSYWGTVGSGTPITGYNNDVTYNDFPSLANPAGSYKIKIETSASNTNHRIITGIAKTSDGATVKAIRLTLSKMSIESAIQLRGGSKKKNQWRDNLIIHWGPVMSFNNVKLKNGAKNREWPQKYSTGYIDPRDTNPTAPNTDNLEYWAYQSLGTPPPVDLDYYRQQAKASTGVPLPIISGGGTASPSGSGYFNQKGRITFSSYQLNNPNTVIFIERAKSVVIVDTVGSPTFIKCKAMIILGGKIHMHTYGQTLTANVPSDAWEQYQSGRVNNDTVGDSGAAGEYPGDAGLHFSNSTYDIPNCWFHGYLYVNRFKCGWSAVNSAMWGVLDVGSQWNANNKTIYYDPAISSTIKIFQNNVNRASWQRIVAAWP